VRLDDELWTMTPLGTIGPPYLLTQLITGCDMSYRPLLRLHQRLLPSRWVGEFVTILQDRPALRARKEFGGYSLFDGRPWHAADDDFVGVVVGDPRAHDRSVTIATCRYRDDRRCAFLLQHTLQFDPAGMPFDDTMDAGWLALFSELAARGVVGVVAQESGLPPAAIELLRRAGFRPLAEVAAERGLGPSDAAVVVATFEAEIHGTEVVRFDLDGGWAPTEQAAAERMALEKMAGHFTVAIDPSWTADQIIASLADSPPASGIVTVSFGLGGFGGMAGSQDVVDRAKSVLLAWIRRRQEAETIK
jgi:hypothetical protein